MAAVRIGLTLMILGTRSEEIRVFDCQDREAVIRAVTDRDPASCMDRAARDIHPDTQDIQILQTDPETAFTGYRCKATITKKVTRCGFNAVTYGPRWPVWQETIPISADECRAAVDNGTLVIQGRAIQVDLGRKSREAFYSHGGVQPDGTCETISFTTAGKRYRAAYELTAIDTKVEALQGKVDLSRGTITFDGGVTTLLYELSAEDGDQGTMVWPAQGPPCKEVVREAYYGQGRIHQASRRRKSSQGSVITTITGGAGEQAMLILQDQQEVCGKLCYSTQVEGVAVCLMAELKAPVVLKPSGREIVRQRQGRAKLFEENLTSNSLGQAGAKVLHEGSLMSMYGPGHLMTIKGQPSYVTRCQALTVSTAEVNNCTVEIPVRAQGRLRFADPFTKVLSDHPTVLNCNELTGKEWWHPTDQEGCAYSRLQQSQLKRQRKPKPSPLRYTRVEDGRKSTATGASIFHSLPTASFRPRPW